MTGEEIRKAMEGGITRFRHTRSGREFSLDPLQSTLLQESDADDAMLIGFPVNPNPRSRGRKWSWLSPRNLEIA